MWASQKTAGLANLSATSAMSAPVGLTPYRRTGSRVIPLQLNPKRRPSDTASIEFAQHLADDLGGLSAASVTPSRGRERGGETPISFPVGTRPSCPLSRRQGQHKRLIGAPELRPEPPDSFRPESPDIGTSALPDERLDLVGQVFEVGTSTEVEHC